MSESRERRSKGGLARWWPAFWIVLPATHLSTLVVGGVLYRRVWLGERPRGEVEFPMMVWAFAIHTVVACIAAGILPSSRGIARAPMFWSAVGGAILSSGVALLGHFVLMVLTLGVGAGP